MQEGGFVSFATPLQKEAPLQFPNPKWPLEPDHAFIAPYYADATTQFVAGNPVSRVWFRSVHRPRVSHHSPMGRIKSCLLQNVEVSDPVQHHRLRLLEEEQPELSPPIDAPQAERDGFDRGGGGGGDDDDRDECQRPQHRKGLGSTQNRELLDKITRDVREGINGADGWRGGPGFGASVAGRRARWPRTGRVALLHGLGRIELGESSGIAVVSAPHRPEAFEAARYAIDALKASAPIWKHETWAGGTDGPGAGWGTGAHVPIDPASVPTIQER